MKKLLILLTAGVLIWNISLAQDVHFSQFNQSPMIINPALTGAFPADHRILANYRTQWGHVAEPYVTYAFSYDAGFMKEAIYNGFLAAGLQFYNDQAGDLKMGITQVNASVAYHLGLNKYNILTAGIQGGYSQRKIDETAMKWDSQYDPWATDGFNSNLSTNETMSFNSFGFADFSGGMLWSFNNSPTNSTSNDMVKGNLGFAVFHVNQPKKAFTDMMEKKMYVKWAVHGYTLIGLRNSNMSLVPSAMAYFQGPAREILAGMLFRFRLQEASKFTNFVNETALSVGAHYRLGDAVVPSALFEIKNFALGVSYDVNVSGLSVASSSMGGLELSMRYVTPIYNNRKSNSLY